nr:hypothetical protein [Tanacetum cinerariifolium]
MVRDTIQLGNAVSTISQEYLLEFTFEYGISESLHPAFPGPEEPIVEFSEGKVGVYTKFFEFANSRIPILQFLFDILGHYQIHLSQLSVIGAAKLDQCPKPRKVKTGSRPHAAYEVPLLTATASRVIDMEDTVMASGSLGIPSTEATTEVIPKSSLEKEVAAMGPVVNKRRRKRGNDGAGANAPPKVLRKDYAASHPAQRRSYCCKECERSRSAILCRTATGPQARQCLAQVMSEERIKDAFQEFKKYEDDYVNSRCAKMDARSDALSIDFDEELYPHMLTTIAGHRWVIRHGLHLAIMKCVESTEPRRVFSDVVFARVAKGMSEGLKNGIEHGKANLDLAAIKAYDPKADAKYVTALYALKDLKYTLIRELCPSSSQLKILMYAEVRKPKDPWSFKEEILLEDAIAANISRAKKKKKCRVVCCTHGVGSSHHARSNGVLVSVPTIVVGFKGLHEVTTAQLVLLVYKVNVVFNKVNAAKSRVTAVVRVLLLDR